MNPQATYPLQTLSQRSSFSASPTPDSMSRHSPGPPLSSASQQPEAGPSMSALGPGAAKYTGRPNGGGNGAFGLNLGVKKKKRLSDSSRQEDGEEGEGAALLGDEDGDARAGDGGGYDVDGVVSTSLSSGIAGRGRVQGADGADRLDHRPTSA